MKEICVDASVILKLVLKGEPHRDKARRLVRASITVGMTLIAPPFYISEVDSVIRKRVFEGKLRPADAQRAFAVLDSAPVSVLTPPASAGNR